MTVSSININVVNNQQIPHVNEEKTEDTKRITAAIVGAIAAVAAFFGLLILGAPISFAAVAGIAVGGLSYLYFKYKEVNPDPVDPVKTEKETSHQIDLKEIPAKYDVRMDPDRLQEWSKRMSEASFWEILDTYPDPIFSAVIRGRGDLLDLTKEETKAHLTKSDSRGCTLLQYASCLGHQEIVEALLDAGANIDAIGTEKQLGSPLEQAIIAGDLKVFNLLLNRGSAFKESLIGKDPINIAILYERPEMVKLLVDRGVDLNREDKEGSTPLLMACGKKNVELVETLIKHGADINKKTNDNLTAILVGISSGIFEIVQCLVDHGADLTQEYKGMTSPAFAVSLGHRDIAEYLLKKAGSLDKAMNSQHATNIFRKMIRAGNFEMVKLLCENGIDISSILEGKENNDVSFFLWAAILGHEKVVRYLVTRGAQVKDLEKALNSLSTLMAFIPRNYKKMYRILSSIPMILERILSGKPTFLKTGYKGHSAMMLVWGRLLAFCDRGGSFKKPLKVWTFDPSKFTLSVLRNIEDTCNIDEKDYKEKFYSELKKSLDLQIRKENSLNSIIQQTCPLFLQKKGNCSYAGLEGSIWAFFVMNKIINLENHPSIDANELFEMINEQTEQFRAFITFVQEYLIEQYLRVRVIRPPKEKQKAPVYKLDAECLKQAFRKINRDVNPEIVELITKLELSFKDKLKSDPKLFS